MIYEIEGDMSPAEERHLNQLTYQLRKAEIAVNYPTGRFVAIVGGEIVADAESIRELYASLVKQGKDPKRALAVQAGVEHPDYLIIFGLEAQR